MNIRDWSKNEIIKNWNEIINTGNNKKYLEKISLFLCIYLIMVLQMMLKYAIEKKINFKKYSVKQKFIDRYINFKTKTNRILL